MFPGFNLHQILYKKYHAEISQWDWEAIERRCKQDLKTDPDDCDKQVGYAWIGTVFGVMPSGKFYMPWTTNQTSSDEHRDCAFRAALEDIAESHDLFVGGPDGVAGDDVFVGMSQTYAAPEGWLEYSVCGNCLIAVANDDYSGMDDDEERAVKAGLDSIGEAVADGADLGFKWYECECCGAKAGDRYRLLARVEEALP
ncbi:hypothetical protein [Cupriavidus necator]